jgi:hypothetical protein
MRRKNRNLFSKTGHKGRLIDRSIPIVTIDSSDRYFLWRLAYPALVSSLILLVHGREVEGSILTRAICGPISSQLPSPVRAPEYLHHTEKLKQKIRDQVIKPPENRGVLSEKKNLQFGNIGSIIQQTYCTVKDIYHTGTYRSGSNVGGRKVWGAAPRHVQSPNSWT